jgi:cytidyltransferase-like protein
VLAVVASDADLTRSEAGRLAVAAHDGIARAVRPAHTLLDGDVAFVLATGAVPLTPAAHRLGDRMGSRVVDLTHLHGAVGEIVALACTDAVVGAVTVGSAPAYADLCPSALRAVAGTRSRVGAVQVFDTPGSMRAWSADRRTEHRRIAVVPTMGALHEGHLELVRTARVHADAVVVTIFVNPLQFNQSADLDAYPRPIAADLAACRAEGVDAVYAPTAATMYPVGSRPTWSPARWPTGSKVRCDRATSAAS